MSEALVLDVSVLTVLANRRPRGDDWRLLDPIGSLLGSSFVDDESGEQRQFAQSISDTSSARGIRTLPMQYWSVDVTGHDWLRTLSEDYISWGVRRYERIADPDCGSITVCTELSEVLFQMFNPDAYLPIQRVMMGDWTKEDA